MNLNASAFTRGEVSAAAACVGAAASTEARSECRLVLLFVVADIRGVFGAKYRALRVLFVG